MSEITSKPSTNADSSPAQPLSKKNKAAGEETLFASLFGGVLANEDDADAIVGDIGASQSDTNNESHLQDNADHLFAAYLTPGRISSENEKIKKGDSRTFIERTVSFSQSGESDELNNNESLLDEFKDEESISRQLLRENVTGQAKKDSSTFIHDSRAVSKMAFENNLKDNQVRDVILSKEVKTQNLKDVAFQSGVQGSKVLSSKLSASMKKIEPASDQGGKELLEGIDEDSFQTKAVARSSKRLVIHQQTLLPRDPFKVPEGSKNILDENSEEQFGDTDKFISASRSQSDNYESRSGVKIFSATDSQNPTNVARHALAGGSAPTGHSSQQNNNTGQSGSYVNSGSSLTNGGIMELLDLAQDNWTEMLLQRVEKGLGGGKDRIEFHLNPRNLGKMRISLIVQNDRTNVHIQTETTAAAQILNEAEARLSQMMDASGIKFGSLSSQYNQNFSNQNFGNNHNSKTSETKVAEKMDEKVAGDNEFDVETRENLINMQA